jgi:predicted RNA polymerase sigma factor
MLREVEGMSTTEVGMALGISDDAVKARLSRARAALRHDLMKRTCSSAPDAFRFYRPRCDRVVARVLERIAGA